MKYFGRRWDAPAFDDATQAPTPLGAICEHCNEAIAADDDGTWSLFLGDAYAELPVHIECWLRQGLGSPAHVEKRCYCYTGKEPPDDRTWREQGREVIRLIGRGAWLTTPPSSCDCC